MEEEGILMTTKFLAIFLAGYSLAIGGDNEFDHVVKAIESHYGTRRTHIPFMGLANFAVRVAHPAGTSEIKLAVFEDLKTLGDGDQRELDHFMNSLSSRDLHPLVRVRSRRDDEATYIFAGDFSKSTRLLIATFQPSEATVIEVKVDVNTLLKWINHPDDAERSLRVSDER